MTLRKAALNAIGTALKVGAYTALGSAGSALAWIAVSSLAIDHSRPLAPAIPDADPRSFTSEGAEIEYYAETAEPGRPLVLIHSVNAAASAREMRPLFDHFRMSRPVYAIDLPGFGWSDRSDRRYSPDLFKRAILDLIEREIGTILQPDVIAMSLSCEFAALAAGERPNAIRSLTMISPTGFGDGLMSDSESRRKGLSFRVWSQAFYDLIASRSSIRYFLKKSFAGEPPNELIDYAHDTSHQPGARFAPLYFLGGQLFTSDVRNEVYANLKIPVLVVYDKDGYTNFENLEPFLKEHANWAQAKIDGTRGMPHWERLADTVVSLDYFRKETIQLTETAELT